MSWRLQWEEDNSMGGVRRDSRDAATPKDVAVLVEALLEDPPVHWIRIEKKGGS